MAPSTKVRHGFHLVNHLVSCVGLLVRIIRLYNSIACKQWQHLPLQVAIKPAPLGLVAYLTFIRALMHLINPHVDFMQAVPEIQLVSHAEAPVAISNPLALPNVLAGIAYHLESESRHVFRALGMLVPRGKQSLAPGAMPGCCFVASLCREAANDAARIVKVTQCRYFLCRLLVGMQEVIGMGGISRCHECCE